MRWAFLFVDDDFFACLPSGGWTGLVLRLRPGLPMMAAGFFLLRLAHVS